MNHPKYIIVHTVAKRGETDIEEIRRWHVEERGWDDIGYHYYIKKDGDIQEGRAEEVPGAHARGFNTRSIGVCMEGHGDYERWTFEQWIAFRQLVFETHIVYGVGPRTGIVIGHRETYPLLNKPVVKTCPGTLIDMDFVRSHL